jgi:hypothetical protein
MLTNEQLISDLHPKRRSGNFTELQYELSSENEPQVQQARTSPLTPFLSPGQQQSKEEIAERREQHREEQRVRMLNRSFTAGEEVKSNFEFFCDEVIKDDYPPLESIRKLIFQENMSVAQLVGPLNLKTSDDDDNYDSYDRGYIVNWSTLTGNTDNRTIEFR